MIDRYFTAHDVGDGTSVLPEISETQSQSVDGTEPVTQDWMVPDQIADDNERKRQKAIAMVNRFEKEHKEKQDQKAKRVMFDEGKEIGRRIADSNKSAKFAPSKKTAKRRLNTVAEEGLISPRRSPRVDYSKRPNYAEVDVDHVQIKRASADDYDGVDFDGPSKHARGKAAAEMPDNNSGGEDSGGEDIDATKVSCFCFYWCFYVVFFFS